MCNILSRSLKGNIFVVNVQKITRPGTRGKCSYCKSFRFNNTNCKSRLICQGVCKNLIKTMTAVEGVTSNQVFQGQEDRFRGITVDSSREPCDVNAFPKKLEASLKHWTVKSFRGIWFKVTLEHADWVPILAENEFQFHHAKPGYVMMYRWLPTAEECNIPPYAHTMTGVGAVVVNDAHEILVVKEKFFAIPHWKFPGGYLEPGEDIGDAAVREVFEETNVKTEFQFLISLRHTHHGMFKCSDIYFIVGLKPISEEISKCNREIAACKWMKIEDFLQHSNVTDASRFFLRKYLEYQKNKSSIVCAKSIHPLLNKPQCVYSIDFNPDTTSKGRSNL
ncbi:nudix hydrolase 2 isoform X2 [Cryptotermes secundus]|uniref:nudix hydrolase 2 isoform X2 n=1 Tax=Cryptotermes secundus TaxID=105785 RepID=UPI000CD7D029|nr:nudix hydrolase 2 isoform X2 [Cryptotermes secundus]